MLQRFAAFADEAAASELDLLRIDSNKLRTAAGFVYGGMLACAAWSVIGLLTWLMVA